MNKKFLEQINESIDERMNEIDKLYEKLVNSNLSDVRRLNKNALNDTLTKVEVAIATLPEDIAYNKWIKLKKKTTLFKELSDFATNYKDKSEDIIRKTVENSILNTADKMTGVVDYYSASTIENVMNPKVAKAIAQEPYSGLTLDEMLSRDREDIIRRTKRIVNIGVKRGESYSEVAKRLKKVYKGDFEKSKVITWTETHRASETAKYEVLEHASKYEKLEKGWISSADELVRPAHVLLNDTYIPVEEDFVSEAGGLGKGPGQMNNAKDDIRDRCILTFNFKALDNSISDKDVLKDIKDL